MKKIFTIILCLILCLSLCSCKENETSKATLNEEDPIRIESSVVDFGLENIHDLRTPDAFAYQEVNLVTKEVIAEDRNTYEEVEYVPVWSDFKSEEVVENIRQDGFNCIITNYENNKGEKGQALYICDFKNSKLLTAEVDLNDSGYMYSYYYSE